MVSPMLGKVCDKLRREREMEIHNKAIHNTQMRNELSCYQHSVESVTAMLKKNTGYVKSKPYAKLKADLEHYLSSLSPMVEPTEEESQHPPKE